MLWYMRDCCSSLRSVPTTSLLQARIVILAYASLLRHGLIPNLMDGGKNPRYNARDATWWYLQAVQEYCEMAPDGLSVLAAKVHRRFQSDVQAEAESHPRKPIVQPLAAVLLEIFRKHAVGTGRGLCTRWWFIVCISC